MFGSSALELVIGLILVFLLYSLLATIVQELIANWLGFRSRMLEKAIIRMLNDGLKGPAPDAGKMYRMKYRFRSVWERIRGFFFKRPKNYGGSMASAFYSHPSIKYLAEDAWHSKPSYISAGQFSSTILDMLKGKSMQPGEDPSARIQARLSAVHTPEPDGNTLHHHPFRMEDETRAHIHSLFAGAGNNPELFRKHLEEWFDNTMQRASGWYKKYAQVVLFFIGLGIAVFFNVNTFKIVSTLSKDKNAREQLVQLASAGDRYTVIVNEMDTAGKTEHKFLFMGNDSLQKRRDSVYHIVKSDLDKSSEVLALGWKVPFTNDTSYCQAAFEGDGRKILRCKDCLQDAWTCNESGDLRFLSKVNFLFHTQVSLKVILGWIVTALAISLGAPFWFDLLNKFMKLRGSVAEKKEEKKK